MAYGYAPSAAPVFTPSSRNGSNGNGKGEKYDLAGMYNERLSKREPMLQRARLCSLLTRPDVMPYLRGQENLGFCRIATAYGARLVNNLQSRITFDVMPPNDSFFLYESDPIAAAALSDNPAAETYWNSGLKMLERKTLQVMEESRLRATLLETVLHQIITGNPAVHYEPAKRLSRMVPADRFVAERDCVGNLLTFVMCEKIAFAALDEAAQEAVSKEVRDKYNRTPFPREEFEIYTGQIRVSEKKYKVCQQIEGATIPGSEKEYKEDETPFLLPRMVASSGEDYARSYCEFYAPYLLQCHRYSKTLYEGTLASARVLFFQQMMGGASAREISKARNCTILKGEPPKAMQVDKALDMRVGYEALGKIMEELGYAFLLTSVLLRSSGERVTAEEQRRRFEEGDRATGGLLSAESVELQLPLVKRTINAIQRDKNARVMVNETLVVPKIISGAEATGRASQLERMANVAAVAAAIVGPERFAMWQRTGATIRQVYNAGGVDPGQTIKADDEVQAEIQQEQNNAALREAAVKSAPGVVDAALAPEQPQAA